MRGGGVRSRERDRHISGRHVEQEKCAGLGDAAGDVRRVLDPDVRIVEETRFARRLRLDRVVGGRVLAGIDVGDPAADADRLLGHARSGFRSDVTGDGEEREKENDASFYVHGKSID